MKKQIVIVVALLFLLATACFAPTPERRFEREVIRKKAAEIESRRQDQKEEAKERMRRRTMKEKAREQIEQIGRYQCDVASISNRECFVIIIDTSSGEIVRTVLLPISQ